MDNKNEIDFPVFTVLGDENFKEDVDYAVCLHYSIQDLADTLLENINQIKNIGSKLNIYINNIVDRSEPFDYDKHILIFNEDHELCVYTHEEVDGFLDNVFKDNDEPVNDLEDLAELFHEEADYLKDIPPTDDKYKLNKKQIATCEDIMDAYNSAYIEYEYNMVEFNELNQTYDNLIEDIKKSLENVNLMEKTSNSSFNMETFDDKIHELLLTKDTATETWKFIYIRKEHHDKFMKILEKNIKKEQP